MSLLLPIGGIPRAKAQEPCPPPAYVSYFADNPAVAAASVDNFDQETLDYFCEYIDQLDTVGVISIAEPLESQLCEEPDYCVWIPLSATEANRIWAAKTAHSIWLDLHGQVSWELGAYTEGELHGLFDRELLFGQVGSEYAFYSVVDYSPSEVYAYMDSNGLIGSDALTTVHLVLDDVRTTDSEINFLHGISAYDPTNTAHTLYDALTIPSSRGRIARKGCHSMSRILLGTLRSVNIPGYETHSGEWYSRGHSSAVFPALGYVVPHGDDIYSSGLRAAPTEEFLPAFDFYTDIENTVVCGSDVYCLSQRHRALLAVTYPANWTSDRCCSPGDYGYGSCEEYLTATYGASLTSGEIAAATISIECLCTGCDPGNAVPALTPIGRALASLLVVGVAAAARASGRRLSPRTR